MDRARLSRSPRLRVRVPPEAQWQHLKGKGSTQQLESPNFKPVDFDGFKRFATMMRDDAHALASDLIKLRHRLHRRPELGLPLPETQEMVLSALDGLGAEIGLGKALSSVTGRTAWCITWIWLCGAS